MSPRYYGRSGPKNQILIEPDVARLYRQRQAIEQDALGELEAVTLELSDRAPASNVILVSYAKPVPAPARPRRAF